MGLITLSGRFRQLEFQVGAFPTKMSELRSSKGGYRVNSGFYESSVCRWTENCASLGLDVIPDRLHVAAYRGEKFEACPGLIEYRPDKCRR